jgi:WD40 repeat protein
VGGGAGAVIVVGTAVTLVGIRRFGDRPRHFSGHTASLTSVAFAPDGKTGVSGSEDKTAKVWNLETGEVIHSFSLSNKVSAVAFSSGGRNVLTGTENSTIALWDALTGRLLHPFLGHTGAITSILVLPDGRTMLSGSSNAANAPAEIITWNLESGNRIRSFPIEGSIGDIAVSPDGRNALFPYNVGAGAPISSLKIVLLDIESGKIVRTFEKTEGVAGFAFSPDGRMAISWGDDIRLWDIAAGNPIRTVSRAPSVNVAFLSQGRRAVSANEAVEIWDIASNSIIRRFEENVTRAPGTSYGTIALAVSPDSRSVLTADADNTLRLWDIGTPQ